MNNIFQDLISEGVVCVYLDDILIFTKTIEEHRWITCIVLEELWEHKLFLRADKCEFECTTIEYLRLIILEGPIEMDPIKVAEVAEWPVPKNKKETIPRLHQLLQKVHLGFLTPFPCHVWPNWH